MFILWVLLLHLELESVYKSKEGFISMHLKWIMMKRKMNLGSTFHTIVEPIFAVMGTCDVGLAHSSLTHYPIAAGAMIFIVVEEVIPGKSTSANTGLKQQWVLLQDLLL